jgi:hypothetical protein
MSSLASVSYDIRLSFPLTTYTQGGNVILLYKMFIFFKLYSFYWYMLWVQTGQRIHNTIKMYKELTTVLEGGTHTHWAAHTTHYIFQTSLHDHCSV